MAPGPEEAAREEIDRLLGAAGWSVQDYKSANLQAARGVALRDGPLLETLKRSDKGSLHLPARVRDRPDRERLAMRFEAFKAAA